MNNQKNSRKSTPEREFILSNQNINDISFMSMENKNDSPYLDPPKATNKTPISSVLKRRRVLDKIFSAPKGNNKISMRNNRVAQKKDDNKSWDMSFIDSSFSNKNTTINSNNIQNECNIKPRNVMKFINKPKLPLSFRTITNESFSDSVTESSAQIIRILFMLVLPIVCIALGIYIFIRRKNA